MSKIEIGEYVRTDEGYILKENDKEFIRILLEGKSAFGKILKHSKNLIDLIEPGDIVNDYYIKELITLRDGEAISICAYKDKESMICLTLKEEDIRTILTHKMYKNNCYEVEE